MARYRMTPARRRALRKAQLVSARKRRRRRQSISKAGLKTYVGRGYKLSPRAKRNIARGVVGAAAVGVIAAGGYHAHYRRNYVTGYHRTSSQSAKSIVKNREWFSDTDFDGNEGSAQGIWFSTRRNDRKSIRFGSSAVKVKRIPKSKITTHRKVMRHHNGGLDHMLNPNGYVKTWFMVDSDDLLGKKVTQARIIRKTVPKKRKRR